MKISIAHVFMLITMFVSPVAHAHFESMLGIDPENDLASELYAVVPSSEVLSAEYLGDGRMLVLTQRGEVFIVPAGGGTASSHFTIPNIDHRNELGALDILIDPDFSSNRRFYVTYSTPVAHQVVKIVLSRFTLEQSGTATRNSQTVLWESPAPHGDGRAHVGGFLLLGPDNKFYISIGDNLTAGNSQNLSTIYGSIIRLNRDGSIPNDNPFVNRRNAKGEIWAYGVRNPFRGSFDRNTGTFIVGDVGGNNEFTAREEINIIQKGRNYGWPLCEGLNGCPSGVTLPVFDYGHHFDGGCCQNKAVMGGFLYRENLIPFQPNTYLFSDFSDSTLEWIRFNDQFDVLDHGVLDSPGQPFEQRPLWMEINPFDKQIYYLNFNYNSDSEIRLLRYTGGPDNKPPGSVESSASANSIAIGQSVTFNGSAADGDGDSLSYRWDFGDGTNASGAQVNKTWNSAGTYEVSLSVSDGKSSTNAKPLVISVGDKPVTVILEPANNASFHAGQQIRFEGQATDFNGQRINANELKWTLRQFHGNHEHPVISNKSGAGFEYTVPTTGHDWQGDTGYNVYLSATDSNGVTETATIKLLPRKVRITFNSGNSANHSISIDDVVSPLPFVLDTVKDFRHRIGVDARVCKGSELWTFENWSNGAAREHEMRVPDNAQTLVANYRNNGANSECGGGGSDQPAAPRELRIIRYSDTAAELFWKAHPDNSAITRFQVFRNGTQIKETDGRSLFESGLSKNRTYEYEVRTIGNNGGTSGPAKVTLNATGQTPSDDPPSGELALDNLRAAVYSPSVAEIFWDRSNLPGQSIKYEIYRNGNLLASKDALSHLIWDYNANEHNDFKVVAIASNGVRSPEARISLSGNPNPSSDHDHDHDSPGDPGTPGGNGGNPVTDLKANIYSSTALELYWNSTSNDVNETFEVSRNGEKIATIGGKSYYDGNLSAATEYQYQVVGIAADGTRSTPTRVSAKTRN